MTTRIYSHPACLDHDPGAHHPERPARLRSLLAALDEERFAAAPRCEAPPAARDRLELVHPPRHVARVLDSGPVEGRRALDADTVMSPGSAEAALRAAGAVIDAVDAVLAGRCRNAFCAVRPPGHHAEPDRAMGFCLFNAIAVGACHARDAHRLSRVAVVDFDVHHGNGTQAVFWDEEGLFYGSTHQFPLYPGTGGTEERGRHGNIANGPMPPGTASTGFRDIFEARVLEALDRFRPEIVLISAGFDAHERDPLAQINLVAEDYAWATDRLLEIAALHAGGRVLSVLEGGYDLDALAESAALHVERLLTSARASGA